MRSFIIIAISLVLLANYLEWDTTSHSTLQQPSSSHQITKVIRDQTITNSSQTNNTVIVKAATTTSLSNLPDITMKKKTPLNLSIPTMDNSSEMPFPAYPQNTHKFNWLKITHPKDEVHYKAELVFDAKEGSSVKGGKVNITIPFG